VNAEAVLSAALGGSELDEGRYSLRQRGGDTVQPDAAEAGGEAVALDIGITAPVRYMPTGFNSRCDGAPPSLYA
jgi:hypothetical protein